ncbi:hypothetical protein [Streptomyces mirabilis]|uniref:hypothetical protein n=1 Tax=Streptomyces mirabilis TaxID=68239 RepID=UPI0033A87159
MNLSGIAALLALVGIPASVLIARWQMRTTLKQAELAHRTALEAAEASRRSTLELAEANHRNALEAARDNVEAERMRWEVEARRAAYSLFQSTLSRFRRALFSANFDSDEVRRAFDEMHDGIHEVDEVGPREVAAIAGTIFGRCRGLLMEVSFHRLPSLEERIEAWQTEVKPLRTELDEAIQGVITGPWHHREISD